MPDCGDFCDREPIEIADAGEVCGRGDMSRAGCSRKCLSDDEVLSVVGPLSRGGSYRSVVSLDSGEPRRKPSGKWKFRYGSPSVISRLSDEEVLSVMAPISKGWYRSRLFMEPTEQKRKPSGKSQSQNRAGKKVVNV